MSLTTSLKAKESSAFHESKDAAGLRKTLYVTFIFIIVALTLLPLFRIVAFLATTGANNPSNDDLDLLPLIDNVLSGTYHWLNFFRDTFYALSGRASSIGHSVVFPALVEVGLAFLSNRYFYVVTLYFGIALAALKLFLTFDSFTRYSKSWLKWLLLPLLSALIFSPSQLSVFEFGYVSLQQGLSQLGLVFGIWSLVKFRDRLLGIILMGLGAIIANWSWGSGPIVLPIFLLGLILLKFRRKIYYLIWMGISILATFPYFYFLLLKPATKQTNGIFSLIVSPFNFYYLLQGIGWPLAQEFSQHQAYQRGLVGISVCLVGVLLLIVKKNKEKWYYSAPSLMLILFSLLNIFQISLFRASLVPWYASPFMLFWVGLLGLAFLFGSEENVSCRREIKRYPKNELLAQTWALSFIVVLIFFYATSNITFEDKSFYLRARSPVSASCLRNYKISPTYCETELFLWDSEWFHLLPQLAIPLDRHGLSVFAPIQQWTLQGDFIQEGVKLEENGQGRGIFWSVDRSLNPVPFTDYRHLNLFLRANNSILWTITLPPNLREAHLKSALTLNSIGLEDPGEESVISEIWIGNEGTEPKRLFVQALKPEDKQWQPLDISLQQFAGQTITIKLTSISKSNKNWDFAVYHYPHIDLELQPSKDPSERNDYAVRPSNTDISPLMQYPKGDKVTLDVTNPKIWDFRNMILDQVDAGSWSSWTVAEDPSMQYTQPLDVCLADYSHFYVRLSVSQDVPQKMLQIFFKLKHQANFDEVHSAKIPLFGDGAMHIYNYDLKLLELDPKDRLIGLRLDPVVRGDRQGNSQVRIMDIGLARGSQPPKCGI